MINYVLVFLSAVGLALQFSLTKLYQKNFGADAVRSMTYVGFSGLAAAPMFFALGGFTLEITWFSAVIAFALSSLCCAYMLLGFKILSLGPVSVYTLFLMLGGMMLPYLYGLVFLSEDPTVFRIAGLLLLAGALICPAFERKSSRKKSAKLYFLLCCIIFLLNGLLSIGSKLHQIETVRPTAGTAGFVILTNVFNFIICMGIIFVRRLFGRSKTGSPADSTSSTKRNLVLSISLIFANAFVGGSSYYLQLAGAEHLPASVLYPMLTGGSVVLTALAGRVFFRERLTRPVMLGITGAFAATILFIF